jgi:type I restriction enzyme M protein
MSAEDVEAIVGAYKRSASGDRVPARVVDHAEIKENGWDLNIGRYLRTEATESVDVPTALAALRDAEMRLREAEARLDERLKASGYE